MPKTFLETVDEHGVCRNTLDRPEQIGRAHV